MIKTVRRSVTTVLNSLEQFVHVFVVVKNRSGSGSQVREATDKELLKGAELRRKIIAARKKVKAETAKLKALEASCKHLLCYDVEGDPHTRYCCDCDKKLSEGSDK